MVYWNVAGVKASEIDTFLDQLDFDLRWDVLVLDFSHARHEVFFLAFGEQGTWYQPNRGISAGEQVHWF